MGSLVGITSLSVSLAIPFGSKLAEKTIDRTQVQDSGWVQLAAICVIDGSVSSILLGFLVWVSGFQKTDVEHVPLLLSEGC